MLRLKLEVCPHGDEDAAYEIGRTYIANDGTQRGDRGSYRVGVCRRPRRGAKPDFKVPNSIGGDGPTPSRKGEVANYPREAYNVWRLICRCLLAAFPEEVPGARSRGVKPVLDDAVVRGFARLVEAWAANPAGGPSPGDVEIEAARRWLAAGALREDEPAAMPWHPSEALRNALEVADKALGRCETYVALLGDEGLFDRDLGDPELAWDEADDHRDWIVEQRLTLEAIRETTAAGVPTSPETA